MVPASTERRIEKDTDMNTTRRIPWSHLHRPTSTLFSIEQCDKCKCDIQAANSITLAQRTVPAGVIVTDDLPEEAGYCEALDMVTCPSCYVAEADEEEEVKGNTTRHEMEKLQHAAHQYVARISTEARGMGRDYAKAYSIYIAHREAGTNTDRIRVHYDHAMNCWSQFKEMAEQVGQYTLEIDTLLGLCLGHLDSGNTQAADAALLNGNDRLYAIERRARRAYDEREQCGKALAELQRL